MLLVLWLSGFEYAVGKISKILGNVVKVDPSLLVKLEVNLLVCIEVDLSKPLRPFVEVESVAYSVIYEGISMICFECVCLVILKINVHLLWSF